MKFFRFSDLFIILLVVLALVLTFPTTRAGGSVVHVIQDGLLVRTLDLWVDARVEIGEIMVIQVEKGAVRALVTDCPDQVCVRMGWISSPGIPIICVPNRIMIVIPREKDSEIDVITG